MSETIIIGIEGPSDAAIAGLLRLFDAEPNGTLLPSGAMLHVQLQIQARTLDSAPNFNVLNHETKGGFGAKVRNSVVAITVLVVVPTSTGTVSSIIAAEVERTLHDANALDCRVVRVENKTVKLDKQGHIREILTHIVETKCGKFDQFRPQ